MESVHETFLDTTVETVTTPLIGETDTFTPVSEVSPAPSDTLGTIDPDAMQAAISLPDSNQGTETVRSIRGDRTLTFDLHPLYGSILQDGSLIRQGEVLGLDGDLRRVLIAPFDGVIRLLVTGTGAERRVRVFLSEQKDRRESFAAGRR